MVQLVTVASVISTYQKPPVAVDLTSDAQTDLWASRLNVSAKDCWRPPLKSDLRSQRSAAISPNNARSHCAIAGDVPMRLRRKFHFLFASWSPFARESDHGRIRLRIASWLRRQTDDVSISEGEAR